MRTSCNEACSNFHFNTPLLIVVWKRALAHVSSVHQSAGDVIMRKSSPRAVVLDKVVVRVPKTKRSEKHASGKSKKAPDGAANRPSQ